MSKEIVVVKGSACHMKNKLQQIATSLRLYLRKSSSWSHLYRVAQKECNNFDC